MPLLTARGKRSFTYSIVILLILGIFASGYLFYFIPHNRDTIHKNGFLILETIAQNFDTTIKNRITFYKNLVNNTRGDDEKIDTLLKISNPQATLLRSGDTTRTFQFTDDSFKISILYNGRRFLFVEPAHQFLAPLFSSQRAEVFSYYALEKTGGNNSRLIYHDEELPLREDLSDSLLPRGSGSYIAGTREITVKNVNMKMFYYPFSYNNSYFILSGFLQSDDYDQAVKRIPFYFVYPIVIIFLVLLIFFPVIKFYVMDSNEPLRVRDLIFFGVSAVLGVTLLTILIIQFLVWKGEEIRANENLAKLSTQIHASFNNELGKVYREMESIDRLDKSSATKGDFSETVRAHLQASLDDRSAYFHFDRISWVNKADSQVMKAELYSTPVFTKVGDRNYIKVFRRGTPYDLPGDANKKFGWEPIYSWTNNEFNVSISMQTGDSIVTLATKMYSLVNNIMPVGYGYCIIDEQGNVMVHSDGDRNLRENFLDKMDRPAELQATMASRQSKTINYVVLYGRLHMIRLQPLDKTMPYYLVTFFDENHIAPVNIRILVFTLLLSVLFFAICIVIWFALAPKLALDHPLVFCKMDLWNWAAPKSSEGSYYRHGLLFMIVYTLSFIGFVTLNRFYDITNFNVLALLLFTPLNIIFSLACIYSAFSKSKNRQRTIRLIIAHLILSVLFFLLSPAYYALTQGFLLFQFFINFFLWVYGFLFSRPNEPGNYLRDYKRLIFSIVVGLAVLPASLFTWYAHNQELLQAVKREQLSLASQLRERSYVIEQSKPKVEFLPRWYFDSLESSYGIYKIFDDSISFLTNSPTRKARTGYEKFYFDLSDKLINPYYKKQSYAALQDEASDSSWTWFLKDSLYFHYSPVFPGRSPRNEFLEIRSKMPARFVFLTNAKYWPVLALLIFLLGLGLYKWLAKNTDQIFLTSYIQLWKKSPVDLEAKFSGLVGSKSLPLAKELYSPDKYTLYTKGCNSDQLLGYEKELTQQMEEGKELYGAIWDNATDKEKFLLFGFAKDGTINYKNAREIIDLMNRGILVVHHERLRLFSPAFRAYILNAVDKQTITRLQLEHKQESNWQYIRIPLMIALIGIAALIFYTQQGVFDKLLVLAGGVSTLISLVTKFFTGDGAKKPA